MIKKQFDNYCSNKKDKQKRRNMSIRAFKFLILSLLFFLIDSPHAIADQLPSSGIEGTTSFVLSGGVRDRKAIERPVSMEFAIAPIIDHKPAYSQAIIVQSDEQGKYRVSLSPGYYWIGAKDKALNPEHYQRSKAVIFSEKVVEVKSGAYQQVDIQRIGLAP